MRSPVDSVVAVRRQLAAIDDLDAVRGEALGHGRAHVGIEAAEHVRVAVDERHLRTEPGEDVRELDADVAAAEDRDPRSAAPAGGTPRPR